VLVEHAVNGGSGDAVFSCDPTEAVSMLTVSTDGFAIEFEGSTLTFDTTGRNRSHGKAEM
jgi:hypothetical protein